MRTHSDTKFVLYTFSVVTLVQTETRTHTHVLVQFIYHSTISLRYQTKLLRHQFVILI